VRYTLGQIAVMRARLQEYVDIGWNEGSVALKVCGFCDVFVPDDESPCGICPMKVSGACGNSGSKDRRGAIEDAGTRYEAEHREAARVHANWLVEYYNAADEGGEWSIE
jgi:hypothetical protein